MAINKEVTEDHLLKLKISNIDISSTNYIKVLYQLNLIE